MSLEVNNATGGVSLPDTPFYAFKLLLLLVIRHRPSENIFCA